MSNRNLTVAHMQSMSYFEMQFIVDTVTNLRLAKLYIVEFPTRALTNGI